MNRRAVITGVGVVSPLGIGSQAHWSALIAGRSAVARVDRLTQLGFPVDVGAEVSGQAVAACLPRLPKKQVRLYNRATTFAMAAASLAAVNAGITAPVADPLRAGVILATLFIPYPSAFRRRTASHPRSGRGQGSQRSGSTARVWDGRSTSPDSMSGPKGTV